MLSERLCPVCQTMFHPTNGKQRYCGRLCKARAQYKIKHPRFVLSCPMCHTTFHQTHASQKYCAVRCKKRFEYYKNHAISLARARQYRETHRETRRAKQSAYRKANVETIRIRHRPHNRNRHARRRGVAIDNLSAAQWEEIQEIQGHRCYYCRKRRKGRLEQDHIQPISKGGVHSASNIVGACRSCNAQKWANGPPIPVQPLLLTLAPPRTPRKTKKAS